MEEHDIEKFIRRGFPENWYDYARELKEAAVLIWRSGSNGYIAYFIKNKESYYRKVYSRTYFLLMGISIENLMKEILISERPNHLENGVISNEISSGHDILHLSSKVTSLIFSDKEKDIFRVLSEVIPYWGKYPIPKNFSKLKSEVFMTDHWFNDLVEVYDKLLDQLLKLNHNGIQGPNNIKFPGLRVGTTDQLSEIWGSDEDS
ncbi:hypothetical protein [Fibrella aestuarina]|uniref:hypothetical protein n=1 Tax=Fibrella aestuarina TaxID=651143 RepID=UPI00059B6A6B|nr:hypothetical protein [Fibrella aestuarina]